MFDHVCKNAVCLCSLVVGGTSWASWFVTEVDQRTWKNNNRWNFWVTKGHVEERLDVSECPDDGQPV